MTTQDIEYHASLKKSVASAYSVTNLMGYEDAVGDTIRLLLEQLNKHFIATGRPCDLHNWLQYCNSNTATFVSTY